jgi:predicted RNase H-like HicB family nuclease
MGETMKEYAVIYERGKEGEENWGAYVPDLPGCITTGETFEEVQDNIRDAIAVLLEVMKEAGEEIPPPSHRAGMVAVAA